MRILSYITYTSRETKKVEYRSTPAWLVRHDKGYITELTLAGHTIGIISNSFDKKLDDLATRLKKEQK